MAPLNANLSLIQSVLPQAASSSAIKVMFVHDSQGNVTQDRIGGGVQKWPVHFIGRLCGFESQSYVGLYHADETDTDATRTRIDWEEDAWSDTNASKLQGWGNQIAFTANVANYYDMFTFGFTAGNYTDGPDLEARWRMGMIVYDAADSPARTNLVEYRRDAGGDTYGIGERFGLTNDTDMNGVDVLFTGAGALHICDMGVRAPAIGGLGDPADAPTTRLGLRAEALSADENGDSHKFVCFFGHESPSGKTLPSTGLFFGDTGDAGLSAYDHTRQDSSVKNAMTEAMGGYDLVIIMLGHNNDSKNTFKANIEAVITAWAAAHTGGGYDEPKFLLIAPWQADNATSWTSSKVADLYNVAIDGDHGFISLWDAYGAESPEPRTERLDGVSAAYTMDGGDLHPNDITTAEAISMDIWHLMQEENWVPAVNTTFRDASRMHGVSRIR